MQQRCPRICGLLTGAVTHRARGHGFNPNSFQLRLLTYWKNLEHHLIRLHSLIEIKQTFDVLPRLITGLSLHSLPKICYSKSYHRTLSYRYSYTRRPILQCHDVAVAVTWTSWDQSSATIVAHQWLMFRHIGSQNFNSTDMNGSHEKSPKEKSPN